MRLIQWWIKSKQFKKKRWEAQSQCYGEETDRHMLCEIAGQYHCCPGYSVSVSVILKKSSSNAHETQEAVEE